MIPVLPVWLRNVLLLLFAALPIACGRFEAGEDKKESPEEPVSELTPAERKTALEAVRGHPNLKAVAAEKVYLTGIEVVRDRKAEGPGQRLALVTHYQTTGDVTIVALVNLASKKVIHEESIAHLPTPLSKEEFELAEKLARAQAEVQKLLAPHGKKIEVQALVSRATLKTDPAFGHRVVHLLFRVGPNYLSARAVVDLTTEQVTVDAARPKQAEHGD